ncbi:MAG: phosphatidylcholine synthase [Rhizobiales bacterium]|nr:phosphatidylcholine synthase [Hyphomicrobiales bacterium]
MSDLTGQKSPRSPASIRAFSVHLLTASGTGLALIAMLEAVREHWAAMFGWLGLALLIDAIDGPLARRLDVGRRLPNWSGETLDLVVDFVTYVFVPAYAITASGLLIPLAAPLLGFAIVVSGALYFADRRMKTDDNHFRGFPALWNITAFYLFLLKPPAAIGSAALALLVVLSFAPVHVIHPVRTMRFRPFNLVLMAVWAALCIFAVVANFDVPAIAKIVLCGIALHILFSDLILRTLIRRFS